MSAPASNHKYFIRSALEFPAEDEADSSWTSYEGASAAAGMWSMDNISGTNTELGNSGIRWSDPQWQSLLSQQMTDWLDLPTAEYPAVSSSWIDHWGHGPVRCPLRETYPHILLGYPPFPPTQHAHHSSAPYDQQYGVPHVLPMSVDVPDCAGRYISHNHHIDSQQLERAGHWSSILPEDSRPRHTMLRTPTESEAQRSPSNAGLTVATAPMVSVGRRCEYDGGRCGGALHDLSPSAINKHVRSHHCPSGEWDTRAVINCQWQVGGEPCGSEMQAGNMGKHIASMHLKSTVSCCPQCGKSFSRTDVRMKHEKGSWFSTDS